MQCGGSVSSLLSVSYQVVSWDKSQLAGLNLSLHYIFKPSYSPQCIKHKRLMGRGAGTGPANS